MAPELAANIANDRYNAGDSSNEKNPYTPKSDMWALGVILYEMCSLRKPFIASNEEELYRKVRETKPSTIPQISRQLMQIIFALLSKEPARRPTVRDLFNNEFLR